ncbi:hypothetical protein OF83DRAFT_1171837 [Amylostereum chailletii]|nr:hypothetical protein OF83DRAFT_1171837 [Amylostereum chailletii]
MSMIMVTTWQEFDLPVVLLKTHATGIVEGLSLSALHDAGIIYLDIKSENIKS